MASESSSTLTLPDIEGCELDASVMFRDEAKDLSSIQNLEEALGRFGYELNDKITRRELVLIYKKIKDAMEKQIFHLANVENRYPEAKEMRQRQIALRSEFDFLQKNAVLTNLKEQEIAFQKAEELIKYQLDQKHKQEVAEMEEYVRRKTEQEEFFHDIQTSNLTQTLNKTHRPNLRLNKRLIELHKAEVSNKITSITPMRSLVHDSPQHIKHIENLIHIPILRAVLHFKTCGHAMQHPIE